MQSVITQHNLPALAPWHMQSLSNHVFSTEPWEYGWTTSNTIHSRSVKLFLSVTTRLHLENAHRVARSRLTATLLPLMFYNKWLCWFPVEINSALHLSRPSSHSATSCPSPDQWHQCTSTPDLGSTPVDREEVACIRTGMPKIVSSSTFQTAVFTIHKHSTYSISEKQDKEAIQKNTGRKQKL